MGYYVSENRIGRSTYENFLKTVIRELTPNFLSEYPGHGALIQDTIAHYTNSGSSLPLSKYLAFMMLACGRNFSINTVNAPATATTSRITTEPFFKINFVTLNYDLLLEQLIDIVRVSEPAITVEKTYNHRYQFLRQDEIKIAKLHGSIDGSIIPPTWSKGSNADVKNGWRLAYNLIKDSHVVLILGYSMPDNDNYFKYLLGVALKANNRLKKIKVVTLDSDKTTEARYDRLFKQQLGAKYSFHNQRIEDFMRQLLHAYNRDHPTNGIQSAVFYGAQLRSWLLD